MQIKEIAWSDTNSRYELKEKADGKIELSVDKNTVIFNNRQAVTDFAHTWSTLNHETTFSEKTTNNNLKQKSFVTRFLSSLRNKMYGRK